MKREHEWGLVRRAQGSSTVKEWQTSDQEVGETGRRGRGEVRTLRKQGSRRPCAAVAVWDTPRLDAVVAASLGAVAAAVWEVC